jgi:hypothetical protein
MDLRSNLIAKKTAVRNCERMVLGLPYRSLNTISTRMKLYSAAVDERADNPIIWDEENNNLVMSREGESEDLFVDEDSINGNNNLPKLL